MHIFGRSETRIEARSRARETSGLPYSSAAFAITALALCGCASPHGPQMVGGPMALPDGSKLYAFDAISQPDQLGLAATDGMGLLRVRPDGHVAVEGWSTSQGPSDAGVLASAAISGAVGLGGAGIIAGATRQGLNNVAGAIGAVDPKHIKVTVPPIRIPGLGVLTGK